MFFFTGLERCWHIKRAVLCIEIFVLTILDVLALILTLINNLIIRIYNVEAAGIFLGGTSAEREKDKTPNKQ